MEIEIHIEYIYRESICTDRHTGQINTTHSVMEIHLEEIKDSQRLRKTHKVIHREMEEQKKTVRQMEGQIKQEQQLKEFLGLWPSAAINNIKIYRMSKQKDTQIYRNTHIVYSAMQRQIKQH